MMFLILSILCLCVCVYDAGNQIRRIANALERDRKDEGEG